MKKLLLLTLLFSIHVTSYAAEGFSTLEERMSGKEFMETGLSKLTDAELAELNEWVRRHSVATLENSAARPAGAVAAQAGDGTDGRGFENQPKFNDDKSYDNKIFSTIDGSFTGWSGTKTQFKLSNGMVWQQKEGGTFNVKATQNPAITIKKGAMGGWRLSMDGYNKTIAVERIK
jgi:hypothetical protein